MKALARKIADFELTPGRAAALAFLFSFVVLLLGTWTHALWDSDETRFAEAAREMFTRHDFLVPYMNGAPRFAKPILVYWIQALGYLIFGVSEIGARLPSVLGLSIAAAFTSRIASRIFDAKTGLAAGLLLATCVAGQVLGRAATADGILLGCVVLTIDAMHARLHGQKTALTFLSLYGGAGLCFLAKGPPAWVAPIAAALGVAYVTKLRIGKRGALSLALGLLLTLGVIAAWGVPALVETHGEFLRQGLEKNATRAGRVFEGHGGTAPWWFLYYFPVLWIFLFPWSSFLPQAYRVWRDADGDRRDRIFLGFWVAITFLVFTVSISKLPHYILPLFPALCVLLAAFFTKSVGSGKSLFGGRLGTASLVTFSAFSLLFGICAPVALGFLGFTRAWVPALSLTFTLAGLILALWLLRRERPAIQGALTLLGTTAVFLLLVLYVLPGVNHKRLVPKVGRALAASVPPKSRRAELDFNPAGLVFYSQRDQRGRLTRETTSTIESLSVGKRKNRPMLVLELLRSSKPAAVVLPEETADWVRRKLGLKRLPGRLVKTKHGFYARRGRWERVEIHVSVGTRKAGPKEKRRNTR